MPSITVRLNPNKKRPTCYRSQSGFNPNKKRPTCYRSQSGSKPSKTPHIYFVSLDYLILNIFPYVSAWSDPEQIGRNRPILECTVHKLFSSNQTEIMPNAFRQVWLSALETLYPLFFYVPPIATGHSLKTVFLHLHS